MNADARQKIERLFQRYAPGVSRYVLLRVSSPELAEEITARVFLTVVRSIDRQKGSEVGWLWSIVRTELARLSRERRHLPYPENLQGETLLPFDELERKEFGDHLRAELERLPEDQQQMISLKFFLGLSNQEIADAVGLSPGNVGVKLHRILKDLRQRLVLTGVKPLFNE